MAILTNQENKTDGLCASIQNPKRSRTVTVEQKLERRINREFPQKKYISDIKINDEEYEILKNIVKINVKSLCERRNSTTSPMMQPSFAVGVVQIALRVYEEGNLWGYFFRTLGIKSNAAVQRLVGLAFLNTLKRYEKVISGETSYVNNILVHCYVSNNYLDNYFLFLYKFYSIDLDRDIGRLDREMMNSLIESICLEGTAGRAYLLVKQTEDAVKVNIRGAKIRIRNHIKLMDKLFWEPEYELFTEHRLYTALSRWALGDNELKRDKDSAIGGRRRGAHHFAAPFLKYNEADDALQIVLPPQSIRRPDDIDVHWHIEGGINAVLPVELKDSVIGYKVLETSTVIPYSSALMSFSLELRDGQEYAIKKFRIASSDIRFFGREGYSSSVDRIKVGEMSAITVIGNEAESPALYEKRFVDGMAISFFNFSFEDIIRLPNGKAIIVGKKEISNGLFGKGHVENVSCRIGTIEYPLYSSLPYLVLRMKEEKLPGTMVELNGTRFRFMDFRPNRFVIDDLSSEFGYYISLSDLADGVDGKYFVHVDIPSGAIKDWMLIYIDGFKADFDGAPYIFQPRGTVTFPDDMDLNPINKGCNRENDENTYEFEIEETGRTVDFYLSLGNERCELKIPIPAVYTKIASDKWTSLRPDLLWHKELPDEIEISVPYHKITLSTGISADDDNSDDTDRSITYKRNQGDMSIRCDIRRFKSYFSGGDTIKTIRAVFCGEEFELLRILTRSVLISASIVGSFDQGVLSVEASIAGKGDYCFDLYRESRVVFEKVPLKSGKGSVAFDSVRAEYRAVFYEMDEDESGFELTDYTQIGEITQEVIDPYDMNGRVLKLIQIARNTESTSLLQLSYKYFIQDLRQSEHDPSAYNGTMVVVGKGRALAAFPVKVYFEDVLAPSKAYFYLYDDYGDEIDFLYDTKHHAIVQEASESITRRESYRIYTLLDINEYSYQVAFTENAGFSAEGLPTFYEIMDPNDITGRAIRRHVNDRGQVHITDVTWSRGAYLALMGLNLSTLNELSDLTIAEFVWLTKADDLAVNNIKKVLGRYRLGFREG